MSGEWVAITTHDLALLLPLVLRDLVRRHIFETAIRTYRPALTLSFCGAPLSLALTIFLATALGRESFLHLHDMCPRIGISLFQPGSCGDLLLAPSTSYRSIAPRR